MNSWNVENYNQIQSEYQYQYGKQLVDKLNNVCKIYEKNIVDLGCGEGSLTNYVLSITNQTGNLLGVDIDEGMIMRARTNYPHISFILMDVLTWLEQSED